MNPRMRKEVGISRRSGDQQDEELGIEKSWKPKVLFTSLKVLRREGEERSVTCVTREGGRERRSTRFGGGGE